MNKFIIEQKILKKFIFVVYIFKNFQTDLIIYTDKNSLEKDSQHIVITAYFSEIDFVLNILP